MKRTDIRAGLDTSVLVRLLVGFPEDQFDLAIQFMENAERENAAVFVSGLVVAESYFACRHHYGLPHLQVAKAFHKLLSSPAFVLPSGVLDILSSLLVKKPNPGLVDHLIHAEYGELHLSMLTFDQAALQLSGVRLLK